MRDIVAQSKVSLDKETEKEKERRIEIVTERERERITLAAKRGSKSAPPLKIPP